MKQLFILVIISYSSILAMEQTLHQMRMSRTLEQIITPKQYLAYQNFLPIINKLKAKINTLLDEAEENREVELSDKCPIVNSIKELRINFDEPHLPQAATKQGLLLIYNKDFPLFKLLSPGGLHILAGYFGRCVKMQWDYYDSLKKGLLTHYLVGEAYNQAHTNSDFWQDCQAFKITMIDGEKVPDLVMGNPTTNEMFYGKK